MAQRIKVGVRIRPVESNISEGKECDSDIIVFQNKNKHILENLNSRTENSFDYVYGGDASTQNIYDSSVFLLEKPFLEGFNASIFAYGQTGSGKTFSMLGPGISP